MSRPACPTTRRARACVSPARGFTLIEILVVLVVVGITLAFATLSVNPSGPSDRLNIEAQRLLALTQDAADEAEVLGGRRLGSRKAIRYESNEGGGGGVPDAALGHQFFMFLNSESDRYNVLYQRGDSNFGLIQPRD